MNICLIFRRKNTIFYSIEKVFSGIVPFLKDHFQIREVALPHFTTGIRSMLKNILFTRRLPADVYHITGDVHYAVWGLPRSKVILTIHDCVFLHNYSGIKKIILKWLLLDMPVGRAAIVTTISEKTRQEILHFCKCDPGKIVVIPNPVSGHIYFTPRSFDPGNPVILFIGSTPNKNLERVINALTGIPCKLVIIGKINQEQEQLLSETHTAYSRYSGLSEQQLADQYATSDIILFPSTYEGFGLPIIEGQKAGRVVITSNISPMKEVAGEGAYLTDPFDTAAIRKAVKETIGNIQLRETLVEKGFQNLRRYEEAAIAGQYAELYRKVGSPRQ